MSIKRITILVMTVTIICILNMKCIKKVIIIGGMEINRARIVPIANILVTVIFFELFF